MSSKKIMITAIVALSMISCRPVGAPDSLAIVADNGDETVLAGDRESGKVWIIDRNGWKRGSVSLCGSVTDISTDGRHRVWVLGSDADGESIVYELEYPGMKTLNRMKVGRGASSVTYDAAGNRLWVTCRDMNELWEIDIMRWSVVGRLAMPRRAAGIAMRGDMLYIAGGLPEYAANDSVSSASVYLFDKKHSTLVKRIPLPDGSTLTGGMTSHGRYAYITHTISHYDLPTIRPEHGWIASSALSVIDMDSMYLAATLLLDSPEKGAGGGGGMAVSSDGKELAIALPGVGKVMTVDLEAMLRRIESVDTLATTDGRPTYEDAGFMHGLKKTLPSGGRGTGRLLYIDDRLLAANLYSGDITDVTTKPRIFKKIGRALTTTRTGAGEALFADATLSFQGRLSCASCHGNDGRTDGLTHMLPADTVYVTRKTMSLASAPHGPAEGAIARMAIAEKGKHIKKTRGGAEPEIAVGLEERCAEAIRSLLFTEPVANESRDIAAYIRSLKPAVSPYLKMGGLSRRAERGRGIFESAGCATCHGDEAPLSELWRNAPYMNGSLYTLDEVIESGHGMNAARLDSVMKRDLKEYLLTL